VVDVWRADLAAAPDELGELLCADERERAAQIVQERDRVLWTRSRGVLRALLGRYLDCDPCALRFVLGPHGKPALSPEGPAPAAVLRPAPAAVLGPAPAADLGPTPTADLGPAPAADLRFNLSHSGAIALYAVTTGREVGVDIERVRERYTAEFLRAWVVREAEVKCRGSGLLTPRGDLPAVESWTAEPDVGSQAASAVAVEGRRCKLDYWEWRGGSTSR
jgi:4'-phosphopantetheinyl transferase